MAKGRIKGFEFCVIEKNAFRMPGRYVRRCARLFSGAVALACSFLEGSAGVPYLLYVVEQRIEGAHNERFIVHTRAYSRAREKGAS